MKMGNVLRYLVIIATLVSAAGLKAYAQPQTKPANNNVQETDDKYKVDTYTKFVENYRTNEAVAYETARKYLERYAKDNDQYSQYITMWVADYEKRQRLLELKSLVYQNRNFADAFKLGKQVLAENPDHLESLIALANAGYLAASARNETYNTESVTYAQKAIQLIESGKTPESWAPFKGKEDTLAYLYTTVGLVKLRSAPSEAIDAFLKTAQLESDLKKTPSTYYYLAFAYEKGPYAKLSADYQKNFADKPETPASKQALEKLNTVIDRIIDAYARAVAAAGNEPANAESKALWLKNLTAFYKFRHGDSDAGLAEFIAGIASKPLPPKP
jgi:hypothetical protein